MKYALLIVFHYYKNPYSLYSSSSLNGSLKDLQLTLDLCHKLNIEHITIISDINDICVMCNEFNKNIKYNVKYNCYPDDIFVCREIAQFIENTIRGIEDNVFKSGNEENEIFFYISCHGGEIIINNQICQGIILTANQGMYKRYLLSCDLFNLFFGNLHVNDEGYIQIPIWEKNNSLKGILSSKKIIECQLTLHKTNNVESPKIKSKPLRSNYVANRGIPSSTKMLILVDTCHSSNMTSFPFKYDYKKEKMIYTSTSNIDFYEDLPFCVTIAACDKKTKSGVYGSVMTQKVCKKLNEMIEMENNCLTIGQLHCLIFQTNFTFFPTEPIISSTNDNVDITIPFFSPKYENEIVIVDK